MPIGERRDADDGDEPKELCAPRRQGGGGYHHRGKKKKCKRILEAACQEEESRKLHDVIAEQQRRSAFLYAMRERITRTQINIETGRKADDRERRRQVQRKAQHVMHAQHCDRLADHGKPAQPDQRVETQTPRIVAALHS